MSKSKQKLDDIVNQKEDLSLVGKLSNLSPATFEDVVAAFHDLLHIEDDSAIKVTLASFIANRFNELDPVWLFLVAPSSSAKTEFVNALDKIPGTFMFSSISPNTLLSGMSRKGNDPSLLFRLSNRTIFLQKDFTTILTMRPDSRAEILGQFRELFDGRLMKETGLGASKRWEGKVGMISGVTLEIENAIMTNSRFGDRFLYFRLPDIDNRVAMRKATIVSPKAHALRLVVQQKVAAYVEHLAIPAVAPELPYEMTEALGAVCSFIVMARAPVTRDFGAGKHIIEAPVPEGPMRFLKEIEAVGSALMVMNGGELTEYDYRILTKLAFDSIPRRRHTPILLLYKTAAWMTTADIALAMRLPTQTVHYTLDELECCGVIERRKESKADEWRMDSHIKGLMNYIYDMTGSSAPASAVVQAQIPVAEMTF